MLRRTANSSCDVHTVRDELGVSSRNAKTVIEELEARRLLVKRIATGIDCRQRPFWENTIKGNALAMATTAPPVKRATADRALAQFLDRVATVNGGGGFAYRVKRVTVFGSYLTQGNELNDVDLLIDMVPCKTNAKEQEILEESIRARAVKSGRRFSIFIDELAWPHTEVCRFLKNRSRTLSLHYTDHALVEKTEHRVVFED